jgi:hypothetical protein
MKKLLLFIKKNNYNSEAMDVLLNNIEDIVRAADFAEKV